jgi:hypothetical protein
MARREAPAPPFRVDLPLSRSFKASERGFGALLMIFQKIVVILKEDVQERKL